MSKLEVGSPLLLKGTIVVGRDIAHAKFKEILDSGKPLPEYLKKHPIYYAGPAKTPQGKPSVITSYSIHYTKLYDACKPENRGAALPDSRA